MPLQGNPSSQFRLLKSSVPRFCSLFNSRHPDPWRVWKGGSEQHLLTPLWLAPLARLAPLAPGERACFLRNKSTCGRIIDHWVLGGSLKSINKSTRYMLQKHRGVFVRGTKKALWVRYSSTTGTGFVCKWSQVLLIIFRHNLT